MKRTISLILAGAVLGGGVVWITMRGDHAKPAAEPPAGEAGEGTHIAHDADGHVVISMSDETLGDIGIVVTNPPSARFLLERKGYGSVSDPAPLAALMTEWSTAQAAYAVSSNEFDRLKTLESQGNASARALQAAEATARRDQLSVQSARDRLALSWGEALTRREDLPAFVQSLTSLQAVLVRVDLPIGETLESPPAGARVVTLSGKSMEAEFLGAAAGVDPMTQGRGFIFLIRTNALPLTAGEAVTGYLKIRGEPLDGVIVPREAIVRTEGKGWVYVMNADGESFTRKDIALDHPAETGWFVTHGVSASDHVVITGAQMLLSEELKASLSAD